MKSPLKPSDATPKKLKPLLVSAPKVPPIAIQILKGAGLALLKPKLFVIDGRKLDQESETYSGDTQEIGYDKKGGLFGMPIWDVLTLRNQRYETFEGEIIDADHMTFDIALLEVVQPRNIVKTSIAGRNGTIKEYMSDGDFNIKVRGCIYSTIANRPPKEDIFLYRKLMSAPIALDVECNLLNYMGIYSVAVDRYTIFQREGVRNLFDIEIDLLSDTPSELDA